MHTGPISLPEPIQARCIALINLGSMLQLFDINLFIKVTDGHRRMSLGLSTILDLQDIVKLCDIVATKKEVNALLNKDIMEFKDIINTFIAVAVCPDRSCGMWDSVQIEFDDDELP